MARCRSGQKGVNLAPLPTPCNLAIQRARWCITSFTTRGSKEALHKAHLTTARGPSRRRVRSSGYYKYNMEDPQEPDKSVLSIKQGPLWGSMLVWGSGPVLYSTQARLPVLLFVLDEE